jgi:hypothetical protein
VSNHPFEHNSVNWSEQLPIDETWHTTGTKGRDLLKGTLVDAVTQPRISWKPPVTSQHQLSFTDLGDPPPVDEGTADQRLGTLWAKSLARETP